jgi:hypothetical protein
MPAHLTSATPRRASTRADKTTTPWAAATAALACRTRDATAGHVYALPTVQELRRPLVATHDPRTW